MEPAGERDRPQPPKGRGLQFASAAIVTYATNVTVAVVSLANVLIVARTLGPDGRGDVAFLMAVTNITSVLANLAVQEANANIGGRQPRLRPSLATNSVLLCLVMGATAIVLLQGLIRTFPALGGPSDAHLRWIAFSVIPILILRSYMSFLIRSDYRFAIGNLAGLIAPIVGLITNAALVALDALTVTTAIVTWVGVGVLETAILVWYVAQRMDGFGFPDLRLLLRSVVFGLKAHIGRAMMIGNYRLDAWFVGSMAGSRELGLYSVAVAWSEALFLLPTTLVLVQRPYLVRVSSTNAPIRAAMIFRASVLLTVPVVVGMLVFAPLLTVTLFGPEFQGSIDDLRYLVLGAFGIIALKQLGNTLTAQRKPVLEGAASGIAFLATIVFDILLIPAHGGTGAAIASTLSYTAGGVAAALIFMRALGASPIDLIPRPREVLRLAKELWASGSAALVSLRGGGTRATQ